MSEPNDLTLPWDRQDPDYPRAAKIVREYLEKCDRVNPDGSSREDTERDLMEPIAQLERELALVQQSSEELRRALTARQDGAAHTEAGTRRSDVDDSAIEQELSNAMQLDSTRNIYFDARGEDVIRMLLAEVKRLRELAMTEAVRTDGVEIVGTLKRGPGEYDERPFYYFSAPGVIPGLHVSGSSLYGVLSGIPHVWRALYEHAPHKVPDPDADDPPYMNSGGPK